MQSLVHRYGSAAAAVVEAPAALPTRCDGCSWKGDGPDKPCPGRGGGACSVEVTSSSPRNADGILIADADGAELEADAQRRNMFAELGWVATGQRVDALAEAPAVVEALEAATDRVMAAADAEGATGPARFAAAEAAMSAELEGIDKLAREHAAAAAPAIVAGFGPIGIEAGALEDAPSSSGDVWSPKVDAVPRNAVTGAAYRGGNVVRLLAAEEEHGYRSGAGWAGFGQWRSVGRVVRKGEHGTACIAVTGGAKEAGADDAPSSSDKKKRRGGGVRGFRVFHFDQTCELVAADEAGAS